MESLIFALADADTAWVQGLARVGWHHAFFAAAYMGVAWLCLVNGHLAKGSHEPHAAWFTAVFILCLLATNAVLQGDLWVAHVVRLTAKLQGWYGARRSLQYLLLGTLLVMALVAAKLAHTRFKATDVSSAPVVFGLTFLLMLLALRMVSAHGTDVVINLHLAGVSVGRMLEFAGISIVALGALRCLRLP